MCICHCFHVLERCFAVVQILRLSLVSRFNLMQQLRVVCAILRLSLLCLVWIWTNVNMMAVCFLVECVLLKQLLTKILVFDVIMSQHKFAGRRLLPDQMGTWSSWSVSGWERGRRQQIGCKVRGPRYIGRKCGSYCRFASSSWWRKWGMVPSWSAACSTCAASWTTGNVGFKTVVSDR